MTLVLLNILLAVSAIVLAVLMGGKAERQGALIIILMAAIAILGEWLLVRKFDVVDPTSIAQDVLAFACFSYVGITSKRIWPLWAAALQLLSVGAHFVRALKIPVEPVVYAWMKTGPTWGVLLLLIAGSLAHHRRTHIAASVRSLHD